MTEKQLEALDGWVEQMSEDLAQSQVYALAKGEYDPEDGWREVDVQACKLIRKELDKAMQILVNKLK